MDGAPSQATLMITTTFACRASYKEIINRGGEKISPFEAARSERRGLREYFEFVSRAQLLGMALRPCLGHVLLHFNYYFKFYHGRCVVLDILVNVFVYHAEVECRSDAERPGKDTFQEWQVLDVSMIVLFKQALAWHK